MRIFRSFIFFLLSVLVVAAALSMLMPVKQEVERTVTIHSPAKDIYRQLIKLENFNKYAVWSHQDSAIKFTNQGTDGTVGASASWKGDPEISGEGKIEIASLQENRLIRHKFHFTKPKEGTGESLFMLNENEGITSVTWKFEVSTPRPWNIFNLFYSLDKKMGNDFDESLATLKSVIEKENGVETVKSYDVQPMNFPSTTFAMIRQRIKWNDMSSFFSQHFGILYDEALKASATPGTASGLFYEWDEKNQEADMAAAIPVPADTKMENDIIRVADIPASKALYVNYYGAYDKLRDAYNSIRDYMAKNKLEEKSPSIEQYITDPRQEKDTSKWLTKVVVLVK